MKPNKKIVINTLVMYTTLLATVLLGLLTSRFVLVNMGVENFGIYSLLVGFVFAFAFVNGAMSTSIQRFVSVALSSGNINKAIDVFRVSFVINIVLSIFFIVLLKTFGGWLIDEYLKIPAPRAVAANWVFNAVVFSCVCQILATPAQAVLNAHERMVSVSIISFVSPLGRFLASVSIPYFEYDGLIYFAGLVTFFGFLQLIMLYAYAKNVCGEIKFSLSTNINDYKEIGFYAAWDLLGNLAGILKIQGPPIIMNMFFGVTANAAVGIMHQITANLATFANQATQAATPQIVKSFSSFDQGRSLSLISFMSNLGFCILLTLVAPFLFKTEYILNLWLVEPPEYTVDLVKIGLIAILIDITTKPIVALAHAAGNIKKFHMVTNLIVFLLLPVMYILYSEGVDLKTGFTLIIIFSIINSLLQMLFLRFSLKVSLAWYIKSVLFKNCLLVAINLFVVVMIDGVLSPALEIAIVVVSCALTSLLLLFGHDLMLNRKLKPPSALSSI